MFEFKDKTIDELRNEFLAHLGKEVTLSNGTKIILKAVSENSVHYLSEMTGQFGFTRNGEFDWKKGIKGVKMYGFIVEKCTELGNGITQTIPERIIIPYDMRHIKMCLQDNSQDTILL